MKKENKNNKTKKVNMLKRIIILILIIVTFFTVINFGRYVTNHVKDMYANSKGFYFQSDKLSLNQQVYNITSWTGVGEYVVDLDVNTYKNDLEKLDYDLSYIVECEVPGKQISCSINKGEPDTPYEGIIYKKNNHRDKFTVTFKANRPLKEGERINVIVKARTEQPYKKEISARYDIKIKSQELDYAVFDQPDKDYATLMVINRNMSDTAVNIKFDPTLLRIDSNNSAVKKSKEFKTTKIDGKDYINNISIILDKESSKKIKFYKVDKTQNYEFPNSQNKEYIQILGL